MYTALTIPSVAEINRLKKTFNAISLFAGCGGASLGIRLAGGRILYASEFVPVAAEAYKLNADKHTVVDTRDIRKVTARDILKACKLRRGEIDYMDFSPPCSAFSNSSRHVGADNYGVVKLYSENMRQRVDDLFLESTRILKGLQPKLFVAENVSGLTTATNRGFFIEIHKELESCGYVVEARLLNASMLGVPQSRERLIFVGVRKDIARRGFKPVFPKPQPTHINVRDVLPHIVKVRLGGNSDRRTSRGYVDSRRPSPTITANDAVSTEMAAFSCAAFIETNDGERRKYKISELKKVFGFPDDFTLVGRYEKRFERLGRTHAPLQAYAIAATLRENILDKL